MNGRGGACTARYSGGGGGGYGEISYGMSKVERIMLKFRPIAPKPTAAGSGSSCSTVDQNDGKNRRRKRKYVRVNGNKKKKDAITVSKKRKIRTSSSCSGDPVVTLSLMPETPDRKENPSATSSPSESRDLLSPVPILLPVITDLDFDGHVIASPSLTPSKRVVTSFVTVECVTETWMNMNVNMNVNLEMDTCPSFITNNQDAVVWTNKAYREMTADEAATVVVKKVNRVTMPVSQPAFTCKVKVTWGTERATSPLTVTAPCDVWRLRCGGYAWRLDVNAALSLGRYS